MADNDLFTLLNHDVESSCRDMEHFSLDVNAIIKELEQNPQSAAKQYGFDSSFGNYRAYPLHQAIKLGANIDVVETMYNCYPPAIEAKSNGYWDNLKTPLHFAVRYGAPADVVLFILRKWPKATMEKSSGGDYPIHYACAHGSSVEIVSLLLDTWPDSVKATSSITHDTPLHCACFGERAQPEVVSLLLDRWPGAARVKDNEDSTPLHRVFECEFSDITIDKISLLLNQYPDALMEKDDADDTPLHIASIYHAPLEVVLMLLEHFPEAVKERNEDDKTPLDIYEKRIMSSENVKKVLTSVLQLFENEMDDDTSRKILYFFADIEWWSGIVMVLDRHPSAYKCLEIDTYVFPQFLSLVGRRCMMKTVWHVMSNELDTIEGA